MVEMSSVCLTFPKAIYRVKTVTNVTKCVKVFARYSLEPRYNTFTVTEGTRSVPTSASGACCKHTEGRKETISENLGAIHLSHHQSWQRL